MNVAKDCESGHEINSFCLCRRQPKAILSKSENYFFELSAF